MWNQRLTVRGSDIDLNASPTSKHINPGPHLQIHLVIKTNADGDEKYDNNGPNHEVEDYSDPNLDEVLHDIDNKGAGDDENVNTSSFRNPSQGIVIRNDLGAYISIIDPDAMHATEFLEYPDILPSH
ncbi:hypothetical protein PVK06_027864 [Gossypium arboreum]|uniref:Uncharacterized protein n=1 Tax=Gossypium arboreum TaxID=29729 RepID=A0ABR0P1D5_GOSAR|nr:hypothetical protein PVK06_027864 [Gossypium arboreum]